MSLQHKSKKESPALVMFLIVAVMLSGGCKDKTPGRQHAAKPEKVTLCIGGSPGIPILLAHEQGLFAKEGLDVTLKKFPGAPLAFEGLFTGECDMVTVGETPVVIKSFERQDFSVLATLATSDDSAQIVANKERGIQKPEDLKGKRIVVLKGSTNHFFLDMFLLKNDISAKAVTLIFKDVKDVSEALKKGRIDAFASTKVLINEPQKALGEKAVVFSSPGLCLITINVLTMNSFIREKPHVVKSVLTAFLKADEFIKKERPQAIKTVSRALNIDEHDMAGILDSYRWDVGLTQTLLLSLEHEAQWAIDRGIVKPATLPNYLNFVHVDALRMLKPEAVTLIK
jgi:ABC-type nitrate/sulfonate/bicarbonate transport system substrate-binding protein